MLQGNLGGSITFDKITKIVEHNKTVFDQFSMVVTIFNKYPGLEDNEMNKLNKYFKKTFKKCFTLIDWSNRGHQFGYIDLDKKGFSFVKNNFEDIDYIFKIDSDYLVKGEFLELDMGKDTDFFYQPSINIPDLNKYGNIQKYYEYFIDENYFVGDSGLNPQANNYILSTKMDTPYQQSDKVKKAYDTWVERGYDKVNQNVAIACGHSLTKSMVRNRFNRKMMFTKEAFFKVMDFIVKNNVGDTTLKNVYLSDIGFCHWQFPDKEVITC